MHNLRLEYSATLVLQPIMKLFYLLSAIFLAVDAHVSKLYPAVATRRDNLVEKKRLHAGSIVMASAPAKAPVAVLNGFDLCLCGAFATVVGDFIMHPVDTIKVFQQASKTSVSIVGAIRAIW